MSRLKFQRAAALAVSTLLVGTSSFAQVAMAQDATEQPASERIDDIIVTATRQATNLQDTPIAITAVTADSMQEQGIVSVGDLSAVVPNSSFRKSGSVWGPGVDATIRGIGQRDTSLASEPVVAFYLDDVYYPTLLGSNFDLLEIDHVEVLRGPQGTLFGRNSLAGAINIVSQQPSTTDVGGRVQVTAGGYNRQEVRGSLNLPLSETLALSVSGLSKKRKGYQDIVDFTCEMQRVGTPARAGSLPYSTQLNAPSPQFTQDDCVVGHHGGDDVQAMRGSLLWKPVDGVKLTLTGDYTQDNSENSADWIYTINTAAIRPNVVSAANQFGVAFDSRFITPSPFQTYATYSDPIAAGTVIAGNGFYNGYKLNGVFTRGGYRFDNHIDLVNWGISAKASVDITPEINLLAVVAKRRMNETHSFDDDGSPINVVMRQNNFQEDYWTAEVRLSGKMDFANWVFGAFYFKAKGFQHASFISPNNGQNRLIDSDFNPTSKALFGNVTLHPFGEQLGIVLGGRYSDDRKVVDFYNVLDTTPSSADTVFFVVPKQKNFDWKAGLNYQVNPDVLLYASAATGNSLPGFNPRPTQPTQIQQYDSNDSVAYELGAKLDLFDRRLRLNAAAFYTDFKNRPTAITGAEALINASGATVAGNQTLVPLPGGPPGSTTCGTATVPAGTGISCTTRTYYRNQPATIKGFELEYTARPVDNLLINGAVGYTTSSSDDITGRAVNRRQNSPFWTANTGVQYTIEVPGAGGTVTPRMDWVYEGSQVFSITSTQYNYLLAARSVFNARLTYDNTDHDFSIAAGATNLFNKVYFYNVFDLAGSAYSNAQPAAPRQWYVTFEKKF